MSHDLTSVSPLTEEQVLSALQARYEQGDIYTTAGFTLIAMNPCRSIPEIYSDDRISSYSEDKYDELPPHIFAVAEKALGNMNRNLQPVNQSIVVSGESGAGKTWTARNLMRYLTATTSKLSKRRESLALVSSIEQQVLDSNPILEAFGNAVTVHNDNSSRFGKYIQLQLNRCGKIVGASIRTYLLEKVRVVKQGPEERSYHIFYQMLAGLPQTDTKALGLDNTAMMMYNQTRTPDGALYSATTAALTRVGFTSNVQKNIFTLLAAIVHLNSIKFEQSVPAHRPSRCTPVHQELKDAASCLGVTERVLTSCLVTSQLMTGNGEAINKLCTVSEAEWRRDCLAKAIYERLFQWIVDFINKTICASEKKWSHFIGLLDVYGFENFQVNSLEQLCINYANERLQQLYVASFLRAEQEVYLDEGLELEPVGFADNRPCVDLISGRVGVFSLLDEECRLNRNPCPVTLCHRVVSNLSKHKQFLVSSETNQSVVFGIRHYAGTVLYCTTHFLDKNQDYIPPQMVESMKSSESDFVREISGEDGSNQGSSSMLSQRRARTVVSKFKGSLEGLMNTLSSTTVQYIRCIRPNARNDPTRFDREKVLQQLRACGVQETIQISRHGYPVKMNYSDFVGRYSVLLPNKSRKSLPKPVVTVTEQTQVCSKHQSSKTLRGIAMNQIQRSSLSRSKRRSSNFARKPQATTDAGTKNIALMIIHNTLGVTSVSIPIHTLNKENKPQGSELSDTQFTGNGYHLGHHRVLLKEDQAKYLEDCVTRRLAACASCIQLRWRFMKHKEHGRKMVSAIHIQAAFRGWSCRQSWKKQLGAVHVIQSYWRTWKLRRQMYKVKPLRCETDGSSIFTASIIHLSADRGIASRHALFDAPVRFIVHLNSVLPSARCLPYILHVPKGLMAATV